jgi:hypothetical protein
MGWGCYRAGTGTLSIRVHGMPVSSAPGRRLVAPREISADVCGRGCLDGLPFKRADQVDLRVAICPGRRMADWRPGAYLLFLHIET